MRTVKTLKAGQKGTRELVTRFGPSLLCVGYRYDADRREHLRTVGLVVEGCSREREAECLDSRRPDARAGSGCIMTRRVALRIGWWERDVQRRVKSAGSWWNVWLRRRAAERPAEAETAFAFADRSRIALGESFLTAQRQEPAAESHLEPFNRALAGSSLSPRLVTTESGGITLAWVGDPDALDSVLAPVLSSAFEVITAAQGRPHVRLCAAPGCPLFFLDRTDRRKWCAKRCGHRVRNQHYYRRVLKAERHHLRKNALRKPRKRS